MEERIIEQKTQPPSDEKQYWAFVSYSSKDRKWGEWLHRRLENYPIPPEFQGTKIFDGAILGKNLRPVFRDRDELSGSSDLGTAISEALQKSRFLVVLCSKNSAKSTWVNKEIEGFQKMGKDKHILALILDGKPNATEEGHPEDECFPPALRHPAEPIAGDLRKEGDGKERGFLKILAGIAQLDFDQLYRRHERLQARKRLIAGIGSMLLVALFAGLAGFAWLQKNRAETARTAANKVINMMLYDLRGELEKRGLSSLHERVNKVVREYFESYPENEFDDAVLREKAVALNISSQTMMSLGRFQDARNMAEEAVDLGLRRPDSTDALTVLAVSFERLGDAVRSLDGPGAAKHYYERCMAIRTLLYQERPNTKTASSLMASYERLGGVVRTLDGAAAAKQYYEMNIDIASNLYSEDSSIKNADYLANAHLKLGDVLMETDGPGNAKPHYQQSMNLNNRIYNEEPFAANARSLAISHERLGTVLLFLEGPGAARFHYERRLELIQRLHNEEPSGSNIRDLSLSHDKLGDVVLSLEGVDAAKPYYERSLELSSHLFEEEPSAANARDLAISHERLGVIALSLENPDEAFFHFEKNMGLIRKLYENEQSVANALDLAITHYEMAEVLSMGEPSEENLEAAKKYAAEGVRLLEELRKDNKLDSNRLGLLTSCAILAKNWRKAYETAVEDLKVSIEKRLESRLLAHSYARLCLSAILCGRDEEALVVAQKGLSVLEDEKVHFIHMTLAHAYLFNGFFEKAEEIYRKYIDSTFEEGGTWKNGLKTSLLTFRSARSDCPELKRLEVFWDEFK